MTVRKDDYWLSAFVQTSLNIERCVVLCYLCLLSLSCRVPVQAIDWED